MKLLCLGDSLTYGFDVRPDESWTARLSAATDMHIDNEGQCGDTTLGMAYRLSQLDLDRYDAFFVMGGSNDILLDSELAGIYKNMENICTALKVTGKPVYLGIPPLTKAESAMYGWQNAGDVEKHNARLSLYRNWLLGYAAEQGFKVIDFYKALADAEEKSGQNLYADGVHPTADGYAVLAKTAIMAFAGV